MRHRGRASPAQKLHDSRDWLKLVKTLDPQALSSNLTSVTNLLYDLEVSLASQFLYLCQLEMT